MRKILAVVAFAATLTGCEYLMVADQISKATVSAVCAQTELVRATERAKVAQWGLWVRCVPAGTIWDSYELQNRPAQLATP